jgi:serine phosphatase RsbU (regulator of sigma subunit)
MTLAKIPVDRPDGDPAIAAAMGEALGALLTGTTELPACELTQVVDVAGRALGATSVRMLVADYGLRSLQELGEDGPRGPRMLIEGTLAGRCFATGDIIVGSGQPATVWVPLTEGSERLGVLELVHEAWTDSLRRILVPVVRILVLVLISKRRYTDVILRGRRSEPLSIAAEIQWALLPPLTYSTNAVSVSGILEPAYSIGGDSFDYALNPDHAEFAIVDAVGHGIAAVSISVLALNGLRNARREMHDLAQAYTDTGDVIRAQSGHGAFATAQIASLELDTGTLTWLNAGHPLPLLVRDRSFIGPLTCRPSLPMGLGGTVNEIAIERLQPGDRVLFYTDGVTESHSPSDEVFGVERLADLLVRASTEASSPAETVRRLASAVLSYNGQTLRDDATLLILEYHGPPPRRGAEMATRPAIGETA